MGLLDSIERFITEHGSAAILKERIALDAAKYADLERQLAESKRRVAELESSRGVAPLRLDLRPTATGDEKVLLNDLRSGGLDLGFGIRLHGHASTGPDTAEELLAIASGWQAFGPGSVRSGWLFHAYYPEPMPDHTFSPVDLWARNACHATVFFKLHVWNNGTGYIHLSSASDHVSNLTLQTACGDRVSGAFCAGAESEWQKATDIWHFTVERKEP